MGEAKAEVYLQPYETPMKTGTIAATPGQKRRAQSSRDPIRKRASSN